MARTYTPQHQLSKYVAGDNGWDVGINDTMDRLDTLLFVHFGNDPETTTGLTYGYEGAMLIVSGVPTTIAAGTIALTDNSVNYIERTSTGTVSKNTTGFTNGLIPIATVQTSAGVITSILDKRPLDTSIASLQDMFETFQVGATGIVPTSPTDTLTFIAGSNITLTPNAGAKSITIAAAAGLALGSNTPLASGAAAVGVASTAAHEDHVHPFSASSPLGYNTTTGALTIQQANGSQPGYLSSTDWTTFNNKQAALGYTAANDSNTVHQTGDETVGGNKTLTGVLTLAAGSTTLQPAKFQAGSLLTTPVAHSIEWDGSYGYLTQSTGPTRKQLAYADGTGASGSWNISISGNASTVTTNANLTGPVTSSGNATTITDNAVTLAKLATMATASFLGRATTGTGNVEVLSATTATSLLNNVVGDSGAGGTKGLVPAPGAGDAAASKFLKADGTWAVPAGTGFTNPMTTLGDTIYGSAGGAGARLAGNTTTTKKFMSQTGDGANSAAPTWEALVAGDYPVFVGDSGAGGTRGAVPAPATGDATKYLKGDGTWATVPALADGDKGDITVSASGATWTIDSGVVTLAKMESRATATFLGRNTAGTGAPEELSVATAKTMLGLTGTNSGDQTITLTGDVTGSGTGSFAATIAAAAVTLAKMENRATQTFIGRNTAGTGVPEELSVATAKTMLGLTGTNSGDQTITLTGDVTGSGTGSFAATIANNAVSLAKMAQIATASFLGRTTAATGNVEVLSASQATALLNTFVGDSGAGGTKGLVPAPATGDATKYLKGDGTWATVPALADGDKGDITVSASGATWTIDSGVVTLAKMENRATGTFIGRNTAGTGVPEELSVATAKTMLNLSGSNTGDQTITLTGDVTGSGTGSFAATVASGAITLAKMENRATQTFIGRNTAGTGVPEELTVATAKTMLGLTGTNSGDQTITLTGDVTGSGTGSFAATIANSAVTLAKMADMATASFLGRNTAGTGAPEVLSVATAKSLLNLTGTNSGDQTITLTGDVTGTGTGSFAATIAANAVTLGKLATVATQTFLGRTTAATGDVEALTATQATAMLNAFVGDAGSGGTKGLVPAPATGDATKYLKGDGTWATPAGGGTPAGADKQIQFNSGGTNFGAEAGFEYDSATNQATIPGLTVTEDFQLSGILSPAQITATQNDYAPTNHATHSVWRLDTDADRTITGISGGAAGRVIVLVNIGNYNITLQHAGVGSTASNRFEFPTAGDFVLTPEAAIMLIYDTTTGRWRPASQTGSIPWAVHDPDAPPASPSAYDDEFDTAASSINTTLWANRPNWSGLTTSDVSTTVPGALYVADPVTGGTGTYLLRAALQALPAGDFSIVACVEPPNMPANNMRVGIVLTDGTTAGAGGQVFGSVCVVSGSSAGVRCLVERYNNFNSYSSAPVAQYDVLASEKYYLRFSRSGSTYYWAHSIDGLRWYETTFTIGITPTHFGICTNSAAPSGYGDGKYAWHWFRYVGASSISLGRLRVYNGMSSTLSGAPDNAQYLTLSANGSLSGARVLSLNSQFTGTDGGAGNNYTIKLTGIDRVTKTANYTATSAEFGSVIEVSSGSATTQTLLTAVGNTGKWITYKNVGAGLVTMASTSSQTIDGQTASLFTIPQYSSVTFYSDGTNWQSSGLYTSLVRVTKTGNYTATNADFGGVIEVNSASATTQTLPTAVGLLGKYITYKNVGAGPLTLATTSSQTIDGIAAANFVLQQYQSIDLYSDNANWLTMNVHRPQGGTFALTSGATVNTDAAQSNSFTLTLGTNITLANPTNLRAGMTYTWRLKQDGTGSRTCAFGSVFLFPGGVDPVLSTAVNTEDLLVAWCDGTNLYCNLLKAFA